MFQFYRISKCYHKLNPESKIIVYVLKAIPPIKFCSSMWGSMMTILFRRKCLTGKRIQMVSCGSFTAGHVAFLTLFQMLSTEHPLSLSFLSISHISWPVRFVDFNHLAPSNSSFPSTLVLSFLPYLIHKEYNCSSHDSPAFLWCQHKERILSQTGSSYPAISHVFLFSKIQVSLALFLSFQGIPSVITE